MRVDDVLKIGIEWKMKGMRMRGRKRCQMVDIIKMEGKNVATKGVA